MYRTPVQNPIGIEQDLVQNPTAELVQNPTGIVQDIVQDPTGIELDLEQDLTGLEQVPACSRFLPGHLLYTFMDRYHTLIGF